MAIVNFDSGAIPAALDNISAEFKLNSLELGSLGCLPYIALTVMSPASGYFLTKYSPKTLIGVGLVINLFANLAMALSKITFLLCFSRFVIGLTQASFLIYTPVWVEEFAPLNWKTCWVALLQASVPIGIDVGYVVSGLLTTHNIAWQKSIWIQVAIMAPLVVIYYFIPSYYINVPDAATTGSRMWNPNETTPNKHSMCDSRRSAMSSSTVLTTAKNGVRGYKVPSTHDVDEDGETHETNEVEVEVDDDDDVETASTRSGEGTGGDLGAGSDDLEHGGDIEEDNCNDLDHEVEGNGGGNDIEKGDGLHDVEQKSGRKVIIDIGEELEDIILDDELETEVDAANKNSTLPISLGARQLSMRTSIHPFNLPQVKTPYLAGLLNGLYLSTIFTLCALFFVVNGMQYWCTIWLTKDFKPEGASEEDFKKVVIPAFGGVAATAPILGVLMGGIIIDSTGGYGPSAAQKSKALKILLGFAILAAASGIAASLVKGPDGFWPVVVLLWCVLFFGGAIVPGETGVMLTSIPAKSRPLASGFGQGSYNIFGYSLGIFLPGGVMYYAYPPEDGHDASPEARRLGMQLLFFWSAFGVVGLLSSMYFVNRRKAFDLQDGFAHFDEDEDDIMEVGGEQNQGHQGLPPSPLQVRFDKEERVVSEVEMH